MIAFFLGVVSAIPIFVILGLTMRWVARTFFHRWMGKRITIATGSDLDTMAEVYGVRRKVETDEELRHRVQRVWGTFGPCERHRL